MDDAGFGHWLAGFIDGEGCFIIHPQPSGAYRCEFRIALRDDDSAILEEILQRTGIGLIVRYAARYERVDGKPQAVWTVRTKPDGFRLVDLLDRYPLRAKKARDYAIWREALVEWAEAKPGGRPDRGRHDWSRIRDLKAMMESGRRYDGPLSRLEDTQDSQLVMEVVAC